jgi:hypothetical protein
VPAQQTRTVAEAAAEAAATAAAAAEAAAVAVEAATTAATVVSSIPRGSKNPRGAEEPARSIFMDILAALGILVLVKALTLKGERGVH